MAKLFQRWEASIPILRLIIVVINTLYLPKLIN